MKNNQTPRKVHHKNNLFSKPHNKSAQIQVAFNWVYILIAGAVILLFFVGIVVKQKASATEDLQRDVVNVLESIMVGASVSEKTMNVVKTSGLSDYIFEFSCKEGSSSFGIKGGTIKETKLQPIFAPSTIKTTQLLLWSLPYQLPYKVMDLLMISSVNTKYFVVGSSSPFWKELEKSVKSEKTKETQFFNFEFLTDLNKVNPGSSYQVRVIDLVGNYVQDKGLVPTGLDKLADSKVTAISFRGGITATYFQKNLKVWEKIDSTKIISLGEGRDAAKYAAIFAADAENYQCNMMKVFKRMQFINEVYGGQSGETGGKLKEILNYYEKPNAENKNNCWLILKDQKISNVVNIFKRLQGTISTCVVSGYDSCLDLVKEADNLKKLNKELQSKSCIQLY